jgi:serine/threonine-protein kinase RsbW
VERSLLSEQEVFLTVPAVPEFLRVVRVTASGLASRLGFSIDAVDDLRLALDELCFALIGKGNSSTDLKLKYGLGDGYLTIEGTHHRPADSQPLNLGELSQQILTALVDEHQIWDDNEFRHFSLNKQVDDARQ